MDKSTELGFKGKVILRGTIKLKTGLHIGGSTTGVEIGGLDNPVIKTTQGIPYIPGSSLKGKIRSLLEISTFNLNRQNFEDNSPHSCDKKSCEICTLFGRNSRDAEKAESPNRLIVRDAFFDIDYFKENESKLFRNLDTDFTEVKQENSIDRLTGAANPRSLERVPAGNKFFLEIIINILHEEDNKLLDTIKQGLKLLEDDYIGGSGTRGSGKVQFENLSLIYRSKGYYEGKVDQKVLGTFRNLQEIEISNIKAMINNEPN